jgi:hypothetical protein
MHDLNSTFKPIDMEMPQPAKRFHLDLVMRLKAFGDGSEVAIVLLGLLTFAILMVMYDSYGM